MEIPSLSHRHPHHITSLQHSHNMKEDTKKTARFAAEHLKSPLMTSVSKKKHRSNSLVKSEKEKNLYKLAHKAIQEAIRALSVHNKL